MKSLAKKIIATFMSGVLIVSLTPLSVWADESSADNQDVPEQVAENQFTEQAVNPVRVNEAVSKFTDALSKFFADTSQMSNVSSFLTRFGGLTSAASGVIGILQIVGIVKDPTLQAIGKVLDAVQNMQTQLNQMDSKLNAIQVDLARIAAAQQEISRNNKADEMLHYWQSFNTNYCEPLEDKLAEYKGMINAGIKDWWESGSYDGIRALYTVQNKKNVLTYAKGAYSQGFPTTADNGETVNKDASFGVPASMLPDIASYDFNVDTYRSWFIDQLSETIIAAANSKTLDASDGFYNSWDKLNVKAKENKAKEYAGDILDTQIYKISCDVMSNNDAWVISVCNAYRKYCDNVLIQNSGVNAMLNAIYLTHGFEGEAKDTIKTFIDSMVVQAGYYGQFALSCAGQDKMQSLSDRQDLQTRFTDTVTNLSDRRNKALTGYDNYCYITGTTLQYDTIGATSTVQMHRTSSSYEGCSSTNWETDPIPSILDATYFQVLANQYKTRPNGASTLPVYLSKYKTGINPNNKLIMTKYTGQQSFSLSEGITMRAEAPFGDYFTNYSTYRINVGNNSDIEDKYFPIHDKVVYDIYDMSNCTLSANATAGARALYGESHWYWSTDEACIFWTDSMTTMKHKTAISGNDKYTTYYYGLTLPIIKMRAPHDMNGGPLDKDNPFFAFDAPSFSEITYKSIGADDQEKTSPLTDVELQSETYFFKGKPIEPKVVVKSHEKIVPEDSYEVTYIDNDAVGIAQVKVEGKGDYSGTIVKKFTITDENPAAAGKVESGKSSGGAKTSGGVSSSISSTPKTGDDFLLVLCGFFIVGVIGAGSLSLARRRQ